MSTYNRRTSTLDVWMSVGRPQGSIGCRTEVTNLCISRTSETESSAQLWIFIGHAQCAIELKCLVRLHNSKILKTICSRTMRNVFLQRVINAPHVTTALPGREVHKHKSGRKQTCFTKNWYWCSSLGLVGCLLKVIQLKLA